MHVQHDHSAPGGIRDLDDRARIDVDLVHRFLSNSYWAHARSRDVVERSIRRGISKALVRAVLDHPELQGLRVVLLSTRDAHGLYAQSGFRPVPQPEEMMALYPAADVKVRPDMG